MANVNAIAFLRSLELSRFQIQEKQNAFFNMSCRQRRHRPHRQEQIYALFFNCHKKYFKAISMAKFSSFIPNTRKMPSLSQNKILLFIFFIYTLLSKMLYQDMNQIHNAPSANRSIIKFLISRLIRFIFYL